MKFSEFKNGDVFMCSGSEYIKVNEHGAIPLSPIIKKFNAEEQVVPSKKTSTTIGNMKMPNAKLLDLV